MNKKLIFIGSAVVVALVATSAVVLSGTTQGSLSTAFASCEDLNQQFTSGIASSGEVENLGDDILDPTVDQAVFTANETLDEDGDGIVCEVVYLPENPDNWESLSRPLETCQLKETKNFFGGGSKGFPAKRWNSVLGNVKIAVIPVDFENAPGEGNPTELFSNDIQLMQDWAQHFSRGKMSYDIEFNAPNWIRAPKGAEWYTCNQCKGAKKELQPKSKAVQELISTADSLYDFTGVEMVYFIFPAEAEEKFGTSAYGFNEPFKTDEGAIEASVYGEMGGVVGARPDRTTVWDHAVHELLHFQGFVGHGPSNWTGHYISVDQWGPSKAVTSWEAFLNGWFDENEILCLDKSQIQEDIFVTMDSVDTFGPKKEAVMVKINEEEIVIVERREEGPFTEICPECYSPIEEGFVAYRVNVNNPQYRDDNDPDSDSKNFWSFLGSSKDPTITDPISFKGVTVSLAGKNQIQLTISN